MIGNNSFAPIANPCCNIQRSAVAVVVSIDKWMGHFCMHLVKFKAMKAG